MHVSVARECTYIYRSDEIAKTKYEIEDTLNIKFSHYTEQQFKTFKQ